MYADPEGGTMRLLSWATILVFLVVPFASAQNSHSRGVMEEYLRRDQPLMILFDDQTSDACRLPRPGVVRAIMVIGLRQAGFTPTDGESKWMVGISVFATPVNDTRRTNAEGGRECEVHVFAMTGAFWPLRDASVSGKRYLVPVLSDTHHWHCGEAEIQEYVEQTIAGIIDEFSVEMLKRIVD
ncbi:MAG: hypothetical protein OEZ03_01930 [Alphaproteobacteria bacterium]|nr:hypothetical protein [Alphaproteobacteria bacterium]